MCGKMEIVGTRRALNTLVSRERERERERGHSTRKIDILSTKVFDEYGSCRADLMQDFSNYTELVYLGSLDAFWI